MGSTSLLVRSGRSEAIFTWCKVIFELVTYGLPPREIPGQRTVAIAKGVRHGR